MRLKYIHALRISILPQKAVLQMVVLQERIAQLRNH